MTIRTGLVVVAASAFAILPAMAQTTAPAPAGPAATASETPGATADGHSENLSKKLSKTGGVIQPKGDVDPGMAASAPDPAPHSTPVIPPSSTGGDTAK